MDITLLYNGYNPQRKKMYNNNPRHNLNSSVDMTWISSIDQSQNMKKNPYLSRTKMEKDLQHKKKQQIYNQYVNKQIEDNLKLDKSTFKVIPKQKKNNIQKYDRKDEYLNYSQMKMFNHETSLHKNSKTISYDDNRAQNDNNSSFPTNYKPNQNYLHYGVYNKSSHVNPLNNRTIDSNNYKENFQMSIKNNINNYNSSLNQTNFINNNQQIKSRNLSKSLFNYDLKNHNTIKVPYIDKDSYLSIIYSGDALQQYLKPQERTYNKHQSLSINHSNNSNY